MSRRLTLRLRQILPFVLVCLAGGATALLQATGLGLAIPPTGQLLLAAATSFCLWGLWRWRRLLPLLPTPPWRTTLAAQRRRAQRPDRATQAARWRLIGVRLRTSLHTPPARPRPAPPPRRPLRRRRLLTPRRSPLPRVRLPVPTLDIQFFTPASRHHGVTDAQQLHTGLAHLVNATLAQISAAPPALLALHDQPRQLVCQLATTPLLTSGQQRAVAQSLQVHGVSASWSDVALLSVRRETLGDALEPHPTESLAEALAWRWLPVIRTRQGTIWWPLPPTQHLVLAGDLQGPLTGLIRRRAALAATQQSPLLVFDPDARLRELNETLSTLTAHADALAEARHAQLTRRFTQERGQDPAAAAIPLLLVIAPSAATWPDLHPLLLPESGVQMVLVLGDREPIPMLRAVCHRLPVVDIPDPRYAPLPDAFRPAGLPSVGVGQALAWMPGGHVVWRGLPPLPEPTPHRDHHPEESAQ